VTKAKGKYIIEGDDLYSTAGMTACGLK
jgi:hypothetical protein